MGACGGGQGRGLMAAFGYLTASASGSQTAPRPVSRSLRCSTRARSIWSRSGASKFSGSTVTRSLLPLPSRTRISRRSNATSFTRKRRPSRMRRIPVPYSSDATSQFVPSSWSSRSRTSRCVNITGRRREALALTTSSSQGSSCCSTSLYRNRMAALAWFWVDADTLRSTARWVRKAVIYGAPMSRGACREKNEAARPVDIGLLGANRFVERTDTDTQEVEQLRGRAPAGK